MELPQIIQDRYGSFAVEIGKGTFGNVIGTSKGYAVKRIQTLDSAMFPSSSGVIEYSTMNNVSSDYVIQLIDLVIEPEYIYLVLPLGRQLKYIRMNMIQSYFHDMCRGVADFHARDMAHHDLKPENFLIFGSKIVLADLGLSKVQLCVRPNSFDLAFTLAYRPPEFLFIGTGKGKPSDVWALGVILYLMSSRKLPFKGSNPDELLINIFRKLGVPTEATWPGVTNIFEYDEIKQDVEDHGPKTLDMSLIENSDAVELIQWMLSVNPSDRPTIYEVLQHPYFNSSESTPSESTPSESTPSLSISNPSQYLDPPGCLDNLRAQSLPLNPPQESISENKVYFIIVDWIYDVSEELELNISTVSYGITLFNYVVSQRVIPKEQLQMLMSVCVHIGGLFYETGTITIQDMVEVSDNSFTVKDAFEMFLMINELLSNNLILSHPYLFAKLKMKTQGQTDILPKLNLVTRLMTLSTAYRDFDAEVLGNHIYGITYALSHKQLIDPKHQSVIKVLRENKKNKYFRDKMGDLTFRRIFKRMVQ